MSKRGVTDFFVRIIAGANIATAFCMLLTGYSYLLNPTALPVLSVVGMFFPFFVFLNILFAVFWLFIYPKKVYIPFLAMVVCYFPVRMYCGINVGSTPPEGALKVMSYNVLDFHGQSGQELDRDSNALVQYLCDEDCDIVCLQESAEGWLTEGCRARLYECYPYHQEDYHQEGSAHLAIYSKHKILSSEIIPYGADHNKSMAYTLKVGDSKVIVINNHLEATGLSLDQRHNFSQIMHGEMDKKRARLESKSLIGKLVASSLVRLPQAQAVADYIESHKDKKIILMGDFNDVSLSYNHHVIGKDLTDCFVASGKGFGWSYCHNAMRVRIDNIMCSKDYTPYNCTVDNYIHYSDHFPIKCWLK